MTRWSASALHLGISLVVGLGLALLTRLVWYPGPLFEVSGAVGLLTILVPVDIVLGPLLTLLVFKAGKPSLRFDLTVIALLQASALVYGAWTIAEVRPVYVVLFGNQLTVVRSLDLAEQAPWTTPLNGPEWRGVESVGAADAVLSDLMAGLNGKKPAVLDPDRYQPWTRMVPAFTAALRLVTELSSESASEVRALLKAEGLESNTLRVMPIIVRDQRMTAVFAENSSELLAIVPVAIKAR